jgi:cytosine/adenosine deaminase-related metal-dependent hydrolase
MMNKIIPSGRRAMGFSANNFFERDHTFDAVVYKSDQPLFFAGRKENILSSIVYTSDASAILGTITAGRWIVKNQIHIRSAEIRKSYAKAIVDLYP